MKTVNSNIFKIENGSEGFKNFPFKTYLSFKPLIEFWEKELLHSNVYKSELVKISLEKIKRIQELNNPVEDYSIIEKYKDIQVEKKIYVEKIPKFIGCFLFVVRQGITDTTLRKMFFENVKLNGETKRFFYLMYSIDKKIKGFSDIDKNRGFFVRIKKWQNWWNIFQNSFCYFRMNNLKCKVIDKDRNDLITEYNIEWVLKNKNIIAKKDEYYIYLVHRLLIIAIS